jgi:hypothetical protein
MKPGGIMNKRDYLAAFMNEQDRIFELWRQTPSIDRMITELEADTPSVRALEASLKAAFAAGWVEGFNHAIEWAQDHSC